MKRGLPLLIIVPMAAGAHDPPPHHAADPRASSDYVTRLEDMTSIEAGKGERIHLLKGNEHGFESLSFILTQTAPGGGPSLHTHESEEAHVLTSGTMSYLIGDQTFVVSAPYILRVPANTPHTFINAGTTPLALTAVFGSAHYTFKPMGPNPIEKAEQTAK